MNEPKIKYKNVDKWVYGEVKEIELIGYDTRFENEKYYFIFWLNHNDEARSTNVSHKELFDWFKIDQAEFDKKFVKHSDLEEWLVK
jgi:hypothetical protein